MYNLLTPDRLIFIDFTKLLTLKTTTCLFVLFVQFQFVSHMLMFKYCLKKSITEVKRVQKSFTSPYKNKLNIINIKFCLK